MATIRELRARFTASAQGFRQSIRDIANETRQMADDTQDATARADRGFANLRSTLMGFAGAYVGFEVITSGVKSIASAMIGGNADMETYHNTLTTILKSSEKATEYLSWAESFASSTPFEIPQIVDAMTKLETYGIESKKVLKDIGNMASITGKPLEQAVEAVADAQTGELERLKEFGITKQNLVDKAREMYGVEIENSKGQITDMEKMNGALMQLMKDRYDGGMEVASKSFKGMVSNVQDSLGTMAREMGKPLFDGLKKQLESVVPVMSAVTSIIKGDWASASKTLQDAFGKEKGLAIENFFIGIQYKIHQAKEYLMGFKPVIDNLVTIFKNLSPVISVIGTVLGTAFVIGAKVLQEILVAVTSVVAKFSEWEGFIPTIAGLTTAIGVFLAITKAQAIWTGIVTKAVTLWTTAQKALNFVMAMNPITVVVALIAGLVVALVLAYKKSETFRNIVNSAWASIKTAVAGVINWFTTTIPIWIENIKNWFIGLGTKMSEIWTGIKNKVTEIWNGIVSTVVPIVMGFVNAVVDKAKQMGQNIMNFISPLIDFFKKTWENIKLMVLSIIGVFLNLITGNFEGLKISLLGIWTAIKNQVINVITTMKAMAMNIFNALKNLVINVITGLKNGAINGFNALKNGAISAWNGLKNGVINLINGLKSGAVNGVNAIKNGVINGFNSAKNSAINAWNALKNGVSNAINNVKTYVSNMKSNITSTIKGINLRQMGVDVIQGFINGIKSMVGAVGKAIKGVAENVTSKIKGALGIHSPSRVFMEIGQFTGEGLGIGIQKMQDFVANATQGLADASFGTINSAELNPITATVDAGAVAGSGGSQTNNTMHIENYYQNTDTDARSLGHMLFKEDRNAQRKKGR